MIYYSIINNEMIFINYQNLTKEIKKNFLNDVKDIAIDNLKDFSSGKNWKTIGKNIQYKVTDNEIIIYPSTNKSDLFGWLHYGTKAHGAVTAKALHWKEGGKHIFVKWVRGIKATNFFEINSSMESKIQKLIAFYSGR
jgi:hypothetical protein